MSLSIFSLVKFQPPPTSWEVSEDKSHKDRRVRLEQAAWEAQQIWVTKMHPHEYTSIYFSSNIHDIEWPKESLF